VRDGIWLVSFMNDVWDTFDLEPLGARTAQKFFRPEVLHTS